MKALTNKDKIVLFVLLPGVIAAGIFLVWPEIQRAGQIADEIDSVAQDIDRKKRAFERMEAIMTERAQLETQMAPHLVKARLARDSDQVVSLLLQSAERAKLPIRLIRPGDLYTSLEGFAAREVQLVSVCSHDVLTTWIETLTQLPLIFRVRELTILGESARRKRLDVSVTLEVCVQAGDGMVLKSRSGQGTTKKKAHE